MARTRVTVGLVALGVVLPVVVALAGCGASSHDRASGPFAWLKPAAPPASWSVVRTHDGATLAYPPRWAPIKTDPGTASVALLGVGGRIDGFLNATPRQGAETLSDWSRLRPRHNESEGDRNVRLVAVTTDGRFRSGRGACVIDSYTTSKATYREVACLVSGPRSSAVVVAAAPIGMWDQRAATLERAVSSFMA
jgi:hypothetical protein